MLQFFSKHSMLCLLLVLCHSRFSCFINNGYDSVNDSMFDYVTDSISSCIDRASEYEIMIYFSYDFLEHYKFSKEDYRVHLVYDKSVVKDGSQKDGAPRILRDKIRVGVFNIGNMTVRDSNDDYVDLIYYRGDRQSTSSDADCDVVFYNSSNMTLVTTSGLSSYSYKCLVVNNLYDFGGTDYDYVATDFKDCFDTSSQYIDVYITENITDIKFRLPSKYVTLHVDDSVKASSSDSFMISSLNIEIVSEFSNPDEILIDTHSNFRCLYDPDGHIQIDKYMFDSQVDDVHECFSMIGDSEIFEFYTNADVDLQDNDLPNNAVIISLPPSSSPLNPGASIATSAKISDVAIESSSNMFQVNSGITIKARDNRGSINRMNVYFYGDIDGSVIFSFNFQEYAIDAGIYYKKPSQGQIFVSNGIIATEITEFDTNSIQNMIIVAYIFGIDAAGAQISHSGTENKFVFVQVDKVSSKSSPITAISIDNVYVYNYDNPMSTSEDSWVYLISSGNVSYSQIYNHQPSNDNVHFSVASSTSNRISVSFISRISFLSLKSVSLSGSNTLDHISDLTNLEDSSNNHIDFTFPSSMVYFEVNVSTSYMSIHYFKRFISSYDEVSGPYRSLKITDVFEAHIDGETVKLASFYVDEGVSSSKGMTFTFSDYPCVYISRHFSPAPSPLIELKGEFYIMSQADTLPSGFSYPDGTVIETGKYSTPYYYRGNYYDSYLNYPAMLIVPLNSDISDFPEINDFFFDKQDAQYVINVSGASKLRINSIIFSSGSILTLVGMTSDFTIDCFYEINFSAMSHVDFDTNYTLILNSQHVITNIDLFEKIAQDGSKIKITNIEATLNQKFDCYGVEDVNNILFTNDHVSVDYFTPPSRRDFQYLLEIEDVSTKMFVQNKKGEKLCVKFRDDIYSGSSTGTDSEEFQSDGTTSASSDRIIKMDGGTLELDGVSTRRVIIDSPHESVEILASAFTTYDEISFADNARISVGVYDARIINYTGNGYQTIYTKDQYGDVKEIYMMNESQIVFNASFSESEGCYSYTTNSRQLTVSVLQGTSPLIYNRGATIPYDKVKIIGVDERSLQALFDQESWINMGSSPHEFFTTDSNLCPGCKVPNYYETSAADAESNSVSPLPKGVIAAVASGVAAVLGTVVAAVYIFVKKKRIREEYETSDDEVDSDTASLQYFPTDIYANSSKIINTPCKENPV